MMAMARVILPLRPPDLRRPAGLMPSSRESGTAAQSNLLTVSFQMSSSTDPPGARPQEKPHGLGGAGQPSPAGRQGHWPRRRPAMATAEAPRRYNPAEFPAVPDLLTTAATERRRRDRLDPRRKFPLRRRIPNLKWSLARYLVCPGNVGEGGMARGHSGPSRRWDRPQDGSPGLSDHAFGKASFARSIGRRPQCVGSPTPKTGATPRAFPHFFRRTTARKPGTMWAPPSPDHALTPV